jgi:MFS family permease
MSIQKASDGPEQSTLYDDLAVYKVFAAYVVGTLFALVALGDLSDHIGRKNVLAVAVANRLAEPRHRAAVVSAFFVAAYIGLGLPAVLIGLISLQVGPVVARADELAAHIGSMAGAVLTLAGLTAAAIDAGNFFQPT